MKDIKACVYREATGNSIIWIDKYDGGPHEANFLKLDCSKLKNTFEWRPRWCVGTAIEKIVEWSLKYIAGEDVNECMERQVMEFLND